MELRTRKLQPRTITEGSQLISTSEQTAGNPASRMLDGKARSVAEADLADSDKLADTGTSPEPAHTQDTVAGNATLAAASNMPLPEQDPHAAHVPPPDEMQQAERDTLEAPLRPLSCTERPQALPARHNQGAAQADAQPVQDIGMLPQGPQRLQQPGMLLWAVVALAVIALAWYLTRGRSPENSITCGQTRDVSSLMQLLVTDDARISLAEMWQDDALTSLKAGAVLLACSHRASCSAAATAVAKSLPSSCSHCLHHFLPGSDYSSTVMGDMGQEMAGHAQKALVARLQQCSHAVVIIDNIDASSPAVLPVLITALSEHGHFEHSRHQIDTTKALYVGILQVPPSLLQQADEEALARAVKDYMVQALKDRGAGHALGAEAGSQTEPLRGRFSYVAEVRLPMATAM